MGSPSEKAAHQKYLEEFRTQQCPLFLQHKCTRHRPFTCFNWHFPNQRRRKPHSESGSFKYSADNYCVQYDESAGTCPNNECPYLHRVAGDVERRYHPRYYKTAMCVYETDGNGLCVRNGAHCAYAHGADDLREPIFETNPIQILNSPSFGKAADNAILSDSLGSNRPQSLSLSSSGGARDKVSLEDARWSDTLYVLSNYKTELCRKPARACRQGYACPFYHNMRDRRRSPASYKYRSTPCSIVKQSDEWGDPSLCNNSEMCQYCHTRTEQQFHPEIYKSTRCNDMLQTGSCPRGPFCAFAHHNFEICAARELFPDGCSPSPRSLPLPMASMGHLFNHGSGGIWSGSPAAARSDHASSLVSSGIGSGAFDSPSSGVEHIWGGSFGREEESHKRQALLRRLLRSIENDTTLDAQEKAQRKQALMQSHASVCSGVNDPASTPASTGVPTQLSGSLLSSTSHDLLDHLDFDFGSELEREIDLTFNSSISNGAAFSRFSSEYSRSVGGFSPTPAPGPSSPAPMNTPYMSAVQRYCQQQQQQTSLLALRKEEDVKKVVSPSGHSVQKSDTSEGSRWAALMEMDHQMKELRLQQSAKEMGVEQQLALSSQRLALVEAAYKKAQASCSAWDQELRSAQQELKQAQQQLGTALKSKKEVEQQLAQAHAKLSFGSPVSVPDGVLVQMDDSVNISYLPVPVLQEIRSKLLVSVHLVNRVLGEKQALLCIMCNERRSVVCQPCGCCLLCASCAGQRSQCPHCHRGIENTLPIVFPG